MSILWKEWRQQRLLFVLGCILGLVGPGLDLLQRMHWQGGGTDAGSIIVGVFGALYALILAAATTHDDVQPGVSDFWQSRPLRPGRVFATKLLVGALLLMVGFCVVESLDVASRGRQGNIHMQWVILTVTWPIAVFLFAATMFLTVLMRDAARSVMVAIWLGLLVYFLPLLVAPLRWMSVFDMLVMRQPAPSLLLDLVIPKLSGQERIASSVMPVPAIGSAVHQSVSQLFWLIVGSPDYGRYLIFVTAALIGTIACLVLTIAAVKRGWLWQPGQKTLAWTIGVSAAVIFSLAMFQLGHNLRPAYTYKGKPFDPIVRLDVPAGQTYDWVTSRNSPPPSHSAWYSYPEPRFCTSGDYLYVVTAIDRNPSEPARGFDGILEIARHPGTPGDGKLLSRTWFVSTPELSDYMHTALAFVSLAVQDNRLFVAYQVFQPAKSKAMRGPHQPEGTFSLRMLVVDVTDPTHPQRIADEPLDEFTGPVLQDCGNSLRGDLCYIWHQRELLVISLADPARPVVLRKIALSTFGLDEDHPLAVSQVSVIGDKLLCAGNRLVLLLGLTDPQSPQLVYRRIYTDAECEASGYIRAAAYADDLLYLGRERSLDICRLSPTPTGSLQEELIGQRRMSPLERLVGCQPHELLLRQGYLYEAAGGFGLLVYDVSDPTQPRRAYHAESAGFVTAIGTWQGLLYMNSMYGSLTLLAMPQ